jgi:hypothetical protein
LHRSLAQIFSFALATATQSNGFVTFVQPFAPQDFDEEIIRIDHALTPSDRLTGRYFLDTYINPAIDTDSDILTYIDGQPNRSQNLLLQEVRQGRERCEVYLYTSKWPAHAAYQCPEPE